MSHSQRQQHKHAHGRRRARRWRRIFQRASVANLTRIAATLPCDRDVARGCARMVEGRTGASRRWQQAKGDNRWRAEGGGPPGRHALQILHRSWTLFLPWCWRDVDHQASLMYKPPSPALFTSSLLFSRRRRRARKEGRRTHAQRRDNKGTRAAFSFNDIKHAILAAFFWRAHLLLFSSSCCSSALPSTPYTSYAYLASLTLMRGAYNFAAGGLRLPATRIYAAAGALGARQPHQRHSTCGVCWASTPQRPTFILFAPRHALARRAPRACHAWRRSICLRRRLFHCTAHNRFDDTRRYYTFRACRTRQHATAATPFRTPRARAAYAPVTL